MTQTNRIRFYLDENVNHDVAEGLRHRQIDVLTTPQAGNMGLSDEEHLAFALAEQRVIVTQDSDFLKLHHQGLSHAGIVYYPAQDRSVKQIIRFLVLVYEVLQPENMENH